MKKIVNMLKNKSIITILISLIIGIFIGLTINDNGQKENNSKESTQFSEIRSKDHGLTNPLYECSTTTGNSEKQFGKLENSLRDYIEITILNSPTYNVAVYFRDLNNGPWFGIKEKEDFAPSSLLKLPVMMAYFKKAEDDPSILSKKIIYDIDPEGLISQNFKPQNALIKGQEYTIEELITRMIQNSDNIALLLLSANINQSEIDEITDDLGIPTANEKTPNNFMDVRDYSALFRVLYNTSYLSKKYSEKALSILSKSEFNNGITGELPQDLTVAHKFGERRFDDNSNQLHDCGIVYFPNHPYLLCVMTKGNDFNQQALIIRQISKTIYSEIKAIHP